MVNQLLLENKHRYYVTEPGFDHLFNAGVLRKDNEALMAAVGFKPICLYHNNKSLLPAFFARIIQVLKTVLALDKESAVVFHFPLHATANKWLRQLLKWRSIKTIAVIVDIDGIRDNNPGLLKTEIHLLGQFTCLVAHNAAMKNFLLQQLPHADIAVIGLFDYPSKGIPEKKRLSPAVCIAGNFLKAGFVYQINDRAKLRYHLYGPGYDATKQGNTENIIYHGVVAPADLPAVLAGSFGLIWDGHSTTHCDEYLQYNNPHKLSLYLAAGLPVIAWDQSAIAGLILEKNIGILVTDIAEMEEKINALTENDYAVMQQNAVMLGAQVRSGFFLKQVLELVDDLLLEK